MNIVLPSSSSPTKSLPMQPGLGAGDEHNHLFVLADDGALFTGAEFDYENNASSYSIRVRVTDELNASGKIFTMAWSA